MRLSCPFSAKGKKFEQYLNLCRGRIFKELKLANCKEPNSPEVEHQLLGQKYEREWLITEADKRIMILYVLYWEEKKTRNQYYVNGKF